MLADSTTRGRFGQLQFRTRHLIQAFLTADLLHNRQDLQSALESSVKLLFSQNIADDLLRDLGAKRKLQQITPSASSLSRHQLQIHAAFLTIVAEEHRQLLQSGFSWFLMADASPTAGQDWLNFHATYVRDQDLQMLLSSAHILVNLADKDELDDAEERAEKLSMELLDRAIHHMYLPPAALGSKRSSAPHKFHCLLHSLRLVMPSWEAVSVALGNLISVTADLGPERLLVNISQAPVGLLFPWAAPAPDSLQIDTAVEDTDLLHADASVAPPTPGARDPSPEPMAPPRDPTTAPRGLCFDTTSAVYVPGILHIIHNATLDLQRVMTWWGNYVKGLSAICKVLRVAHYRKRLLTTCFSSGSAAHLAFLFKEEPTNDLTVQETRWASVATATVSLARWEGALRTHWDVRKFCYDDVPQKGLLGYPKNLYIFQ